LIIRLSVVLNVALAPCSASGLVSAHPRHPHHSEVSSHSVVEKHTFEFSVGVEAQDDCYDVVGCQHAHNSKLKGWCSRSSPVNAADLTGLDAEADDIDEREKVDCDVDHVES